MSFVKAEETADDASNLSEPGAEPLSMVQIYEAWDSEEEGRKPSPAAGDSKNRANSKEMFIVDPVIEQSRYCLGYGKQGKKYLKLVMRDADDPDKARLYTVKYPPKNGHQLFHCPCNKKVVAVFVDGERVVKGRDVPHECPAIEFRVLFFSMKKWTSAYGTDDEAEAYHRATRIDCDEPGFKRVNQRDFNFAESYKCEKHSVVFIREDHSRQVARKYVLNPSFNYAKTGKAVYFCSCEGPRARVIIYMMPSGIPVAFKCSDRLHKPGCVPVDIKYWSAEYEFEVPDHQDMDILRIVPPNDWSLGYSSLGKENCRLIVKERDNPSLCREYGRMTAKTQKIDKVYYMCTSCQTPYYAYYFHGQQAKVMAPNVCHSNCQPKTYESAIQRQDEYIRSLPLFLQVAEASAKNPTVPKIPNGRIHLNKETLELQIVCKDNMRFCHKFEIMPDSPTSFNAVKSLRCVNCPSMAFLRNYSHGKFTIRNDAKHAPDCKPFKRDQAELLAEESINSTSKKSQGKAKRSSDAFSGAPPSKMGKSDNSLTSELERMVAKMPRLLDQQFGSGVELQLDGSGAPQPGSSDCPVDLDSDDEESRDAPLELQTEVLMKPSNAWIAEACCFFNMSYSNAAYKVWGTLQNVDLSGSEFPSTDSIKLCRSGFSLVSYILTGAENNLLPIKEKLNKYFFDNHSSLGTIAGLDCSKMSHAEMGTIIFSGDMVPVHFALLSTMIKCTVIVYDYNNSTRLVLGDEDPQAPTLVVGQNEQGYFLFVE